MIKIDNISVMNLENAFRGLRNPMNSWDKSDSEFCLNNEEIDCVNCPLHGEKENLCDKLDGNFDGGYVIGPKDMSLAQRMISAGESDSKFLRQILVCFDIDAPLYWWKEMDTYKVATVANSCSTMHKLSSTPITRDCFSFDDSENPTIDYAQNQIIAECENLRAMYNETKDQRIWRALVQLLPEGWNQKRTWTANYATLRNIYFQRKNHRLTEWHDFCAMIENLPYGKELICYQKSENN